MEDDLTDNVFLTMMLQLLEESRSRQSRNHNREEVQQQLQDLLYRFNHDDRIKAAFRMSKTTRLIISLSILITFGATSIPGQWANKVGPAQRPQYNPC
jgi:hypothetical protein